MLLGHRDFWTLKIGGEGKTTAGDAGASDIP